MHLTPRQDSIDIAVQGRTARRMTPARNRFISRTLIAVCSLAGIHYLSRAADAETSKLQPARAALRRLIPSVESQISLSLLQPRSGGDAFRISGTTGDIRVEATSNVAALFAVNWYLKYVEHAQISSNGDQVLTHGKLAAPPVPIDRASPYAFRYALNENTDGYSTPYWDWPRWEREIDVLAANGTNAMLIERGTDVVLYRTFRDFGYSDNEIRHWITLPAHQNWQLMGEPLLLRGADLATASLQAPAVWTENRRAPA